MATPDLAVEGIRGVLQKLRTHAGLTVERLAVTEVDLALLANLPAVRHLTNAGRSVPEAIVAVVTEAAGGLDPAELLVADAALALGVVRERAGDHPAVRGLAADDLGDRREALVRNWAELHDLLGAAQPRRLTVRNLRGSVENRALGALAALVVGAPGPGVEPADRHGGVTVVGGAVMDRIFMVGAFAEPNTSVEAVTYKAHPGGKGLNLTTAAARMGLSPRLISTIGDDHDADRVLDYMRDNDLHTDHVRRVPGAETPVTAVIVAPDGRSTNYAWRNIEVVRRTEDELAHLRPLVAGADAVLVTFEPSAGEVAWALRTVAESDPKPLLLVQPAPRMDAPQQLYQYLPYVDYLVGSEQDLRDLLGPTDAPLRFNEIAGRLFNAGVRVICAVENLTCRVRAHGIFTTVSAPEALITEAPAARERFSAALVRQLLKFGPELTDEKLSWAAAAMAANNRPDSITESMPEPADVDELLQATTSWRE